MNSRISSGYTNNDMYPITGYESTQIIAPSGYIELDDSLNMKNVPSREKIMSKEDLSFCFNNYLVPKYGLDNLNVSNVGSFMKELEMNWNKLTPDTKENAIDILVVILSNNYDLKKSLMKKLSINDAAGTADTIYNTGAAIPQVNQNQLNGTMKSTFGKVKHYSRDDSSSLQTCQLIILFLLCVIICMKCNNQN